MNESIDAKKRKFIKQAGTVAMTAPAAAVILSAASKPALAQNASGGGTGPTEGPTIQPTFTPPTFTPPNENEE
jgi:hypothetical protein